MIFKLDEQALSMDTSTQTVNTWANTPITMYILWRYKLTTSNTRTTCGLLAQYNEFTLDVVSKLHCTLKG